MYKRKVLYLKNYMEEKILLTINQEVTKILRCAKNVEKDFHLREIPGEANKNLGLSSLELVELIVNLEDIYKIELSMDKILKMQIVKDLIENIMEKLQEQEEKRKRVQNIEKKLFEENK